MQVVAQNHEFSLGKNQHHYNINLIKDFKLEAIKCKSDTECDKQIIGGKWTSIYDQSIHVELDNGIRFLANLRYNIKPSVSKDPLMQAGKFGLDSFGKIESGDYDKFDSQCDQTMIGFV